MTGVARITKLDFFDNEITSNFIFFVGCGDFNIRTYRFTHYCVMYYRCMVYRIDGY